MGAQAFGTDAVLVDMRRLNRVHRLEADRGVVEVDAGLQWPALISALTEAQRGWPRQWSIRQKQTGADRLTLGGALAANIHGRGLTLAPLVGDVEAFTLVDATGHRVRCSRNENADLFRLAIGGYGLFGIVATIALRLTPRRKLERVVELRTTEDLSARVEARIQDGYLYGDFQFAIDPGSDDFLRRGVFSCYRPVDDATPLPERPRELTGGDWARLIHLAHVDKSRAFREYAGYYLSTSGQVYWSDAHQLSYYLDDYHAGIDAAGSPGAEMITEVYVPRARLEDLLREMRRRLRANPVSVVYGTIRFVEPDSETFLPWARERYACVVVNLHVPRDDAGRRACADAFRDMVDLALARGGSYYLTYHRHARRDQVLAAYPEFPAFLAEKRRRDPGGLFQSDWYRHYRAIIPRDR